MSREPLSAEERRDLVRRLRAAPGQGSVKLDAAEEIAALGRALAALEAQPSAAEVLDPAEAAVDEALKRVEAREVRTGGAVDVFHELRVELGLAHPQGAHHRPPGFAEAVERLLAD